MEDGSILDRVDKDLRELPIEVQQLHFLPKLRHIFESPTQGNLHFTDMQIQTVPHRLREREEEEVMVAVFHIEQATQQEVVDAYPNMMSIRWSIY